MRLLERLPRETGRDYALRTIKENIISLDLAPGSQISENELSVAMGLSRTPVREALMDLAKVKVVLITPQKKSVVAPIDYDMVDESRFMREVMECAVIELVCEMATDKDLHGLDENVKLQNFYLADGNFEQIMRLDDEFHERLFNIAQKSDVYTLTKNILIHFDRVRNMALSSVSDLKIVQDHGKLVEAIRARDAAEARRLMQHHLNRYKFDAEAIREKYPQYFS